MSAAERPPDHLDVALKEWAGIVQALADGTQTILLRKGGIDEGPNGFRPEHPWFWLYPTAVHQAQQGLREPYAGATLPADATTLPLRLLAGVQRVARLDRLEDVERLAEHHAWTDETIGNRFRYRAPGLWLMVLRVYAMPEAVPVAIRPEHAGCHSWVPLGEAIATRGARPVIEDRRFTDECSRVEAALGPRRS